MTNQEVQNLLMNAKQKLYAVRDPQARDDAFYVAALSLLAEIAQRLPDRDAALAHLEEYRRKGEEIRKQETDKDIAEVIGRMAAAVKSEPVEINDTHAAPKATKKKLAKE